MSKPKYKVTGFAKFFVFMLFLIPVSYVVANYIQGKDPITEVKKIKEKGISILKNRNFTSTSKNIDYAKVIVDKDAEIQALKEQLFICEQSKK